jgi:hypothetical protein
MPGTPADPDIKSSQLLELKSLTSILGDPLLRSKTMSPGSALGTSVRLSNIGKLGRSRENSAVSAASSWFANKGENTAAAKKLFNLLMLNPYPILKLIVEVYYEKIHLSI